MIKRMLAVLAAAASIPVLAQSVPAANYSDIWWNHNESGWGVTFTQHPASNQAFAVWYTYDPRETDPSTPTNFKPLWFVMPGGTWTSPTTLTGDVYVTKGSPFFQPWAFNSSTNPLPVTRVGTFTFAFSSTSAGTFTYNITPPSGVTSTDPAFNLPAFSGTKTIERQSF